MNSRDMKILSNLLWFKRMTIQQIADLNCHDLKSAYRTAQYCMNRLEKAGLVTYKLYSTSHRGRRYYQLTKKGALECAALYNMELEELPWSPKEDVTVGHIEHQEMTNNTLIALARAYPVEWIQNEYRLALDEGKKPTYLAPDGAGIIKLKPNMFTPFTLELDRSATQSVKSFELKFLKHDQLVITGKHVEPFRKPPVHLIVTRNESRLNRIWDYLSTRQGTKGTYLLTTYEKIIERPTSACWNITGYDKGVKVSLSQVGYKTE